MSDVVSDAESYDMFWNPRQHGQTRVGGHGTSGRVGVVGGHGTDARLVQRAPHLGAAHVDGEDLEAVRVRIDEAQDRDLQRRLELFQKLPFPRSPWSSWSGQAHAAFLCGRAPCFTMRVATSGWPLP